MDILLNGQWLLEGTDEQGQALSFPITVPGFVHQALEKNGVIPPMFFGDNAKQCQWIETHTWTFSRTFDLPEEAPIEKAVLVFDGVDTVADVYVNGTLAASGNNMFTRLSVPAGALLKRQGNELRVVVHPYNFLTADKPPAKRFAFRADRVHVRRVQCTFWWDWVERFVGAGIWKDVRLTFPEETKLSNVYAYTADIAQTSASVKIRIQTENAVKAGCRFRAELADPEGHTVWLEEGRVFLNSMLLQADIRSPRLWWPAGYGEQPLYTLTVSLLDENGRTIETKTDRLGIRTVRLEQLMDETEEEITRTKELRAACGGEGQINYPHPGQGMILLINGTRVFGKGGNWVPPSPFAGMRTNDEYENLIRLAKEGNMNFLRVWGGGEYEPDVFYDLCDRYGIMLMHDFMLACGEYPDQDPDFVIPFREEVRENVIRLRNHASIVFWNANNENTAGFDWDDPNTMNQALLENVYLPVLAETDPAREFRPGSPYGGYGNEDLSVGDNHVSWWWRGAEKMDAKLFDVVGRFTTESPFAGYPLPSTLKRFLKPEDWDPESPVMDYHIKTNAYFAELGWPTVHGRLKRNARIMLGERDTLKEKLYQNAYVQYEWARFTIEGSRRAKWYCAALQFWMYNDCWPAVGYAAVDYFGRPKAGWYGARRAFAPLAASLHEKDGKLELWGLNDTLADQAVEYELLTVSAGQTKTAAAGSFTLNANENAVMAEVEKHQLHLRADTLTFLILRQDGKEIDRARWYPGWLAEVDLKKAEVEYLCDGDTVRVTCKNGAALGVAFDGDFIADDNFFDLLPGETKTVHLVWENENRDIALFGYSIRELNP